MSFFFLRSLLIGTYVYSSFNVYFQHTCMKYCLYKPCAVKCHNSHLHSHGKWVGKKSRTRLWTLYRIIFQFVFFFIKLNVKFINCMCIQNFSSFTFQNLKWFWMTSISAALDSWHVYQAPFCALCQSLLFFTKQDIYVCGITANLPSRFAKQHAVYG